MASLLFTQLGHGSLLDTNLPSKFFGWNRGIHIYLPPSYSTQPQRRYPVLYLHDGQNVFSSAGTNAAFGWGSWELDKTADALARAGKMQEIIMVALDNSWGRREEYGGLHHPTNSTTNTAFEKYTAFLLTELKPRIDREYRTLPGPAHTAVMGSSLGGICGVVLAWDHPEIFGGAASLSGSDTFEQTNFLNALKTYHGQPKPVRIYLDSGVVDYMGGDDGCSLTRQVAAEFRRIGWTNNLECFVDARPLTPAELEKAGLRRDKWAAAQTNQHSEFYWRLRSWRALTFLFPPSKSK
ncbi:MAG: alpha/beta hydrolase-fold protein [Verrucomicrobiales bacterium]|nr:alpha/beta hydrolase-fold protein [Verrucomicrobiales bacterium]